MSLSVPKREAVIVAVTTPELAAEALAAVTLCWVKHGLLSDEYQKYWCQEKVDQRGNRCEATGRSARPMINVRDGPTEQDRKNQQGQSSLVTYTKFLGTHVVLYSNHRTVPRTGYHASHLCHNERCIRPTHLRVENATLNQQRKGCPGLLLCCFCNKKWQLCRHNDALCLVVTQFVCCDSSNMYEVHDEIVHDEV